MPSPTSTQRSTPATTIADATGNTWLVRRVSQRTPDFGVIAIDLGSVRADAVCRYPPAGRRCAVGRRRHARAPRRRARAQRSKDALGDRAAARSADRLGVARTAHAAVVDPRRRDRAAPVAGDRQGRAPELACRASCATRRSGSTTTSRTCSTRPASAASRSSRGWNGSSRVDIVNSALERRRRRLAVTVSCSIMDSNLPFIYVDPVLVEQAFVQIVDNAAKYSPAGSTIRRVGKTQWPRRGTCRSTTLAPA